jgi:glycosyltransferase involved in cell wall biosynthesis
MEKKLSSATTPRVSVIIPVYNCDRYIQEAVESVLNQTYSDYEIIVVDDGSTDDTRSVLEPCFDRIHYIYQENQGASAARNRGLQEARGEFVAFLDADDFFLLPSKLAEQVACFEAQPSLGIVHSGWRVVNQQGEKMVDREPWYNCPKLDLKTWVTWIPVFLGATMFRRDGLERIGGFDPQLRQAEDIDILFRLTLMGCKSAWLEKIVVGYRQHNSNTTSRIHEQAKFYDLFLNNFFARPELPTQIHQLEQQVRYQAMMWLAWSSYRAGKFSEMAQYLRKSLSYTSCSPTETISNWIELLTKLASECYSYKLNIYSLSSLPEWQQLIHSILLSENQNTSVIIPAFNKAETIQHTVQSLLNQNCPSHEIIGRDNSFTGNPYDDLPQNFEASSVTTPRLSVIIPVYNCDHYIQEAVESVLNQTYGDYEIIVVDDGSIDNTCRMLEPYLDRIRYIYQENQGVSVARNRGIEEARGEFVAFLDADDFFLLPSKLADQVACFEAQPSLGLVISGWRMVNQQGKKIVDREPWRYASKLDLETWLLYKPVLPSAMMFVREWLQRVGGFDPRFPPSEDVDIACRLALMGCQSAWLQSIAVGYRQHDNNASNQIDKQAKSVEAMLNNFFALPDLPDKIYQLENEVRYYSLLWTAWCFYHNSKFSEMAQYLQKSLRYAPQLPTEIISNWIVFFSQISSQLYNYKLDTYSLSNLPEWQQLIHSIFVYQSPLLSLL